MSVRATQSRIRLIGSVVEFFSHSGPMRAYVLAREDAVRHWREVMGPTKVFRARYTSPASIRGQFGLTDTRNTTHGSGREVCRSVKRLYAEGNKKKVVTVA